MKTVKVSHYRDIPHNFTGIVEWHDGTKSWHFNGKLHRVDGPAIEQVDGEKSWYFNGKLHRVDGPARVWPSDRKEWWLNNLDIYSLPQSWLDYIVIEEGLPSTMEWLGEPVSTLKVLTATGIKYIPNLPGI